MLIMTQSINRISIIRAVGMLLVISGSILWQSYKAHALLFGAMAAAGLVALVYASLKGGATRHNLIWLAIIILLFVALMIYPLLF
jgi:hypothetical protein